ncbi:MAG: ATP-binding cassette domain-containing protein, partial [Planctomycetota bacterium]
VYDDMKVIEYLEFFASAYRIVGEARRRKCEEVLELVDLTFKREALVTSLSRGMTQRLGLARVLLHDPQVLLLDEPASGLDPRARIEMRRLLKKLRGLGKTIMISSHILPELSDICNKIGIIEKGQLLFNGDVAEAIRQVRQNPVVRVGVADGRDREAADLLEKLPEVFSVEPCVEPPCLRVTLSPGTIDPGPLADALVGAGFRLRLLMEEEIDLEDVFLGITKGITS